MLKYLLMTIKYVTINYYLSSNCDYKSLCIKFYVKCKETRQKSSSQFYLSFIDYISLRRQHDSTIL